MAGRYGDLPERGHRLGYLNRWQARERFLTVLHRLNPGVLAALLESHVVSSVLEPAQLVTTHYPGPHGERLSKVLFRRPDGLFFDTNWSSESLHSHPDFSLLRPSEAESIDRIVQRLGMDTIVSTWSRGESRRETFDLPVKDMLRLGTFSDDDGQIFVRQIGTYAPILLRHLTRWMRSFNLDAPWLFLVGGKTILAAADNLGGPPPEGYYVSREWNDWFEEFSETWLPNETLSVKIHDQWNPRTESKTVAGERLSRKLLAELDRIEKAVGAVSQKHVSIPQEAHFEWLVRYQIDKHSFNQLAEHAGYDRKSITGAIKRAADIIDLPLRPPHHGGRNSRH